MDIIALMDENDFTSGKSSSHGQFLASSDYVKTVTEMMVKSCPNAIVAVFANPVTANLPLVSDIYRRARVWNPDKIIGSTAIHSMRIESIAANFLDLNPAFATIPIVGGADACTVVPLFSQAKPINQFSTVRKQKVSPFFNRLIKVFYSFFRSDAAGVFDTKIKICGQRVSQYRQKGT